MITVDGRVFDTDARWRAYCKEHKIADPFKEEMKRIHDNWHELPGRAFEFSIPEDEEDWRIDWEERRDEYLRQMHTFRLWDMHFWMEDWEQFQRMGKGRYVDMSIYLPCDIASRQCSMWCPYFGEEPCLRSRQELISPIVGLEGRYEPKKSR